MSDQPTQTNDARADGSTASGVTPCREAAGNLLERDSRSARVYGACPFCGLTGGFHDEAQHALIEVLPHKLIRRLVLDANACRNCGATFDEAGANGCRNPRHGRERADV